MRNLVAKVAAIGIISSLGAGCSIAPLSHEGLAEHQATRSGTLNIAEKAEGLPGSKVGWGRLTPFAIPIVPIYIQGDESIDLMNNIKEALALAGYTANTVSADGQAGNALTLHATVNKKRYSNYTYFAPLVPTWGSMDVTLSLQDAIGEKVWEQNFRGGGFTMNFFDGYNIASRESMTEILDQMVIAFDSDEFYGAISDLARQVSHSSTTTVDSLAPDQ